MQSYLTAIALAAILFGSLLCFTAYECQRIDQQIVELQALTHK